MNNRIRTDSIKDIINALNINNYDSIKELIINKLSINGNINYVDIKEINYFSNLDKLTICNLIIDEDIFNIINNKNSINYLEFINCEFLNPSLLSNLNCSNLLIDNTNINLRLLKNSLNNLTLNNMEYVDINIKIDTLDISKSNSTRNNIKFNNVNNLIISSTYYNNNIKYISSLEGKKHVVIKNDYMDFVEKEI